jgi:putative oxidoreductase
MSSLGFHGEAAMIEYGSLVARFCLSYVFLWSGISKLLDPVRGSAEVAALGLPMAPLFLSGTIICQIAGGLMVLLGFWPRLGAVCLLGFTIVATLLAHRPSRASGAQKEQQMTTSLEHLAIVGGFILVIIYGSGALSIDSLLH